MVHVHCNVQNYSNL